MLTLTVIKLPPFQYLFHELQKYKYNLITSLSVTLSLSFFLFLIVSYLLQRNYSFLGDINIWPPLVTIGVYLSSISASMSNLIGASRILYALARDNLFGEMSNTN